jgi:hypothetical protein
MKVNYQSLKQYGLRSYSGLNYFLFFIKTDLLLNN